MTRSGFFEWTVSLFLYVLIGLVSYGPGKTYGTLEICNARDEAPVVQKLVL